VTNKLELLLFSISIQLQSSGEKLCKSSSRFTVTSRGTPEAIREFAATFSYPFSNPLMCSQERLLTHLGCSNPNLHASWQPICLCFCVRQQQLWGEDLTSCCVCMGEAPSGFQKCCVCSQRQTSAEVGATKLHIKCTLLFHF